MLLSYFKRKAGKPFKPSALEHFAALDILQSIDWQTSLGVELEFMVRFKNEQKIKGRHIAQGWSAGYGSIYRAVDDYGGFGHEARSPIYSGDVTPNICQATDSIKLQKTMMNEHCGFHVHAGMDHVEPHQCGAVGRQMFVNYILVEPAIYFPFERIHKDYGASPRSISAKALALAGLKDHLKNAFDVVSGQADLEKFIEIIDGNIEGIRSSRPYNTLEWKAPQGTLCPVQIAAGMKFWHDFATLTVEMALSDQGPHLPLPQEADALKGMVRTYNGQMRTSPDYVHDVRVERLTSDVDTLEMHAGI